MSMDIMIFWKGKEIPKVPQYVKDWSQKGRAELREPEYLDRAYCAWDDTPPKGYGVAFWKANLTTYMGRSDKVLKEQFEVGKKWAEETGGLAYDPQTGEYMNEA